MAWGFGTWDANGVDNNTGLVKINALGSLTISDGTTGTFNFALPTGYTMDFLVQAGGDTQTGRRRIAVSGSSLVISLADSGDYSAGTYPRFANDFILVYAR